MLTSDLAFCFFFDYSRDGNNLGPPSNGPNQPARIPKKWAKPIAQIPGKTAGKTRPHLPFNKLLIGLNIRGINPSNQSLAGKCRLPASQSKSAVLIMFYYFRVILLIWRGVGCFLRLGQCSSEVKASKNDPFKKSRRPRVPAVSTKNPKGDAQEFTLLAVSKIKSNNLQNLQRNQLLFGSIAFSYPPKVIAALHSMKKKKPASRDRQRFIFQPPAKFPGLRAPNGFLRCAST